MGQAKRKIEVNNRCRTLHAIASFYLRENDKGVPHWRYMDRERMKFIFFKALNAIQDMDSQLYQGSESAYNTLINASRKTSI